ncbi:hypothetical protein AB6A40_005230 [Gnathostoma spinigerum]|uniref:Uncharacterized protein n=1 Tax=Gnathostoma spinigerum TaxID=75299 RepID=A0ABD6EM66_9BILA
MSKKPYKSDKEEYNDERSEYDKLENSYLSLAKTRKYPISRIWSDIERMRTVRFWRPLRDQKIDIDDPNRLVEYEDIRCVLVPLSQSTAVSLMLDILDRLGASIYNRCSVEPAYIMNVFCMQPDLSLPFHNFTGFLRRFFDTAASYIPQSRSFFISSYILSVKEAMIRTCPSSNVANRIAKELQKIVRDYDLSTNVACMATVAETFLSIGQLERAKQTSVIYLNQCSNIWELRASTGLVSFLRLVRVLLLSSEESQREYLLVSVADYGNISNVKNEAYDFTRVEKFYNDRIAELVQSSESNLWEGSALGLIASLATMFSYYGRRGGNRFPLFISTLYDLSKTLGQEALLSVETGIGILQNALKEHKELSPKVLIDILQESVVRFPKNLHILKQYINANLIGGRLEGLRRFLATPSTDLEVEIVRAYGSVYLELLRFRTLVDRADQGGQAPEVHKLRQILWSSSERLRHRDVTFCRMRLYIENERQDKEHANQAFYLALNEFAWSKDLIMDYVDIQPDEFSKLYDVMVEKDIRIFCEGGEEVNILLA